MKWINRNIWHPFMAAWQEKSWFEPLVSIVVITIAVSLFYDILKEVGGLVGTGVAVVLFVVVLLILVCIQDYFKRKKQSTLAVQVSDKPNPPSSEGLILMASNLDTARSAIAYHKVTLLYCWIVSTPEMSAQADKMKKVYEGQLKGVIIRPIKDKYDTRGCYDLIRDIFINEAPRLGLESKNVIADITGGTKPMTVAMLLAALEGEYALEHIPTEFDSLTNRPKGPLPPIQISVDLPPWSLRENSALEDGSR